MSVSAASSATAAKVADINQMLRLCGQRPIPALDTDGPSPAGEAERYYDDARDHILSMGWHCNTEDVELTKNVSDHFVVPAGTLSIDTTGASERYNVVARDGNLYSLDENTADWGDAAPGLTTLKVRTISLIAINKITPLLRRAILTDAALRYARGVMGDAGKAIDVRLTMTAREAMGQALAENTRQADTNMLDTDHAINVRGGRNRTALRRL